MKNFALAGKLVFLPAVIMGAVLLGASTPATKAATATFTFAEVGSSFSAALFADDPLVGKEIVSARIYLDVESFAGSDAANFFTDISFPIEPFPGNTNAVVYTGAELGWSGSGTFHYFEETTRFNGIFQPFRYGGETSTENFDGMLLDTSRIEFDYIDEGGEGLSFTSAASRKTHERRGEFEVELPLTGTAGIESRSGPGESEVVFTFNNEITAVGEASSTCGRIGRAIIDPSDAHKVIVRLGEIACNRNEAKVTLDDLSDSQGNSLDSVSVTFGVLFGDVNADGRVDQTDVEATREHRGQLVNESNFRADLNLDGRINNRDIELVKRFRGDSLP